MSFFFKQIQACRILSVVISPMREVCSYRYPLIFENLVIKKKKWNKAVVKTFEQLEKKFRPLTAFFHQ